MKFISAACGRHNDAVIKIEKIFFDVYLPSATGDYVKVYLYGMGLAIAGAEDITVEEAAAALHLTADKVEKALTYWTRQGLIESDGEIYVYCDLAEKMAGNGKKTMPPRMLNQYADFNCRLQELFPDRLLQMKDYTYAHDWIEVMGLSEEVVLKLVSHVIETRRSVRGNNFMAYADKIAQDWAMNGINTVEKADEYILTHDAPVNRNIQKILNDLGILRKPTRAEINLYDKWKNEWGFDEKAIRAAAANTAFVRNPNFTHVDELLDRLRTGAGKPFEIELLRALGIGRSSATAGEKELLEKWYGLGASDELILYATNKTLTLRNPTTYHVDKIVVHWVENGIKTVEEAEILWKKEIEEKKRRSGQQKSADFAQRSVTAEELARDVTDVDRLISNENKK